MAWLYKQKDSENWWIGYRVNGKKIQRSLGTPDRKLAEQEQARLESVSMAHKAGTLTDEFIRHLTRRETSGEHSLNAYVRQWLAECKDLSPQTVSRYEQVIREFCTELNANDSVPLLRDIQSETVAGFLRKKRAETSLATAKLTRRILSAFFGYAIENKTISSSPVPSSRSLKLNKDERAAGRRAFTLVELQSLFSAAPVLRSGVI